MTARSLRYFSTQRVEGYTDAVFAIAATLLVLDLTTSALGTVDTDDEMWAALAGMSDSFVAFAVSFILLSLLWIIHLQQWRDIERVDGMMLWLNNARLLFIVLIPFTTSLVADFSRFYAGRMLLPVNFFFAALFGVLSWRWAAARNGHLLRPGTADLADQGAGGIAALICAAIAVLLSPWIGSWGFWAFALNGPLTVLIQRQRGRRGAAHADGAGRDNTPG